MILKIKEHPGAAVQLFVAEKGPRAGDFFTSPTPLVPSETELDKEIEPAGDINHKAWPDTKVMGIPRRYAVIVVSPSPEIVADVRKQVRNVSVKGRGDADVRVYAESRSPIAGRTIPKEPPGNAQADVSVQDSSIFQPDRENAPAVSRVLQVKENATVCLVCGGWAGVRVPNLLSQDASQTQHPSDENKTNDPFHIPLTISFTISAGSVPP